MPQEPTIEQQLLSHEAERQVADKMDAVEKVDIDVKTDFLKMIQGHADGVKFAGQGMVLQKDIRVQEIQLQTSSVDIDPLKAVFGQIELNHPVSATARMVMTEADINHALASDYIRAKLQKFDLNVSGDIVTLEPQQIQVYLPGSGKIGFSGKVLLQEAGNTRPVSFTAIVSPRTLRQPLTLESFNCTHGGGVSLEFIAKLIPKLEELVNLPYFELQDMALRIKDMEIEQGSIVVIADAYVRHLPTP